MRYRSPLPAVLAKLFPFLPPQKIMRLDAVMRACSASYHRVSEMELNVGYRSPEHRERTNRRLVRAAEGVDKLILSILQEKRINHSYSRLGLIGLAFDKGYIIRLLWGGDARGPGGRLHTNHPDLLNGDSFAGSRGEWAIPSHPNH